MEPVGDLHGIGCTAPGGLYVGADAVAADDLHTRVIGQPDRQGAGFAGRQHVDHAVGLAVEAAREALIRPANCANGSANVRREQPSRPHMNRRTVSLIKTHRSPSGRSFNLR